MTASEIAGIQITGLTADSRQVQPGFLFAALPGSRADGRDFITDAVRRGAVAVLAPPGTPQPSRPDDVATPIALLLDDNPRRRFALLAARFHLRQPQTVAAVTGTNGKTSVVWFLQQIWTSLGFEAASLGTLGVFSGPLRQPGSLTTPDPGALHDTLARLAAMGVGHLAMEASSHGLDQYRLDGVRIAAAAFTNLTRDHLDYHGNMERYAAAKARLFDLPGLKAVVLNLDDRFGMEQARRLAGKGMQVIGYTLNATNADAAPVNRAIVADKLTTTAAGIRFTARCAGDSADLSPNLVGQFNVSNLLAVIGTLMASGFSLEEAATVAEDLTPPLGRMQTLGGVGEPLVVVDYAHSPDALEQVLAAVRPTATARDGRLVCVFGCGGDRDPGKRPLMGEVASRLADRVVLTSDNPRCEDPQAILRDILPGCGDGVTTIPDRAEAIRSAILAAAADDVIVVAGKGHEPYQEINEVRHPFSDVEQTRAALEAWNNAQGALS